MKGILKGLVQKKEETPDEPEKPLKIELGSGE